MAAHRLRPVPCRSIPVRDTYWLAAVWQRLPNRRRWPEHAPAGTERVADAERGRRFVAHRAAPAAVFQPVLNPRISRLGRVQRWRPVPVLPFLGTGADPDVPGDRDLGRRPTRV